MVKEHKSVKGLKFGDSQNMIDRDISTGVMSDLNDDQELINDSNLHHDTVMEQPQGFPEKMIMV